MFNTLKILSTSCWGSSWKTCGHVCCLPQWAAIGRCQRRERCALTGVSWDPCRQLRFYYGEEREWRKTSWDYSVGCNDLSERRWQHKSRRWWWRWGDVTHVQAEDCLLFTAVSCPVPSRYPTESSSSNYPNEFPYNLKLWSASSLNLRLWEQLLKN